MLSTEIGKNGLVQTDLLTEDPELYLYLPAVSTTSTDKVRKLHFDLEGSEGYSLPSQCKLPILPREIEDYIQDSPIPEVNNSNNPSKHISVCFLKSSK